MGSGPYPWCWTGARGVRQRVHGRAPLCRLDQNDSGGERRAGVGDLKAGLQGTKPMPRPRPSWRTRSSATKASLAMGASTVLCRMGDPSETAAVPAFLVMRRVITQ